MDTWNTPAYGDTWNTPAYGDTWNTQGRVVTCWGHIERNHTMTDTGMERNGKPHGNGGVVERGE